MNQVVDKPKIAVVPSFIIMGIYLLAIAIGISLMSGKIAHQYKLIKALPIFYFLGLIIILFLNPKCIRNVSKCFVLILYGVRMGVVPLLISINRGYVPKQINAQIYENMGYGVVLQCYEFLCVMIVLIFLGNYEIPMEKEMDIWGDFKRIKFIRLMLIMMTLACGGIITLYPMMLGQFRPITFSTQEKFYKWLIQNKAIKSQVPMVIYYLGSWALKLTKIVLVYYGIILIRKLTSKRKQDFIGMALSLGVISTLLLITTDDKAGSVYASIVMIVLLVRLYPSKKKFLISSGLVGLGVVVSSVLLGSALSGGEGNSGDSLKSIIDQLNAYFSGSLNIAAALTMPHVNKFEYLKGDILTSIPLLLGFFTQLPRSFWLFNRVLGMDAVFNSQILPCVGQGYFYLGFWLAPVFPVLLITSGMRAWKKAVSSRDSFGYFLYTFQTVFLCAGTVLYDFFLTLNLIMNYCVPFWVVYKLFVCKEIKRKE